MDQHLGVSTPEEVMRATLVSVAPGTELRDGLDRVLRGNTGALVVLGFNQTVEAISSGGFALDVEFSAPRLRELAKMDGAVVVDRQTNRIVRAAVQLMPDSSIQTTESGTRHRTAERVAKQAGLPTISVSQSMRTVAIYAGGLRHVLEDTDEIASRAKQALATLERYRDRLDEVSATLSALEVEDLVTVRDVAQVAQRSEMVGRIADEIDSMVLELGTEGRLLHLQYEELISGVALDRRLLVEDYLAGAPSAESVGTALTSLRAADQAALLELDATAAVLGLASSPADLDTPVSPRGYRLVHRVPRLPDIIATRLVEHFGTLQRILAASMEDLQGVEGVGEPLARAIREGLSRIAETSILERYV
ncbi:MAG: DNA integrity scanning diadenylate cyclase DisA [Bifidobacteriaceae bacterium]|jgi:diadenylate cyclase|nr:DNA integrity scanning diadenylate cyclase DisA [Bifidobacteriaceae bacterium]